METDRSVRGLRQRVGRGCVRGMLAGAVVLLGSTAGAAGAAGQACWSQSAVRSAVSLVPSGDPNLTWTWNNSLRTRMMPLGCASVDGNIWSVSSGQGGVTMNESPTLTTRIALSNYSNSGYIIGFPEILYGYKPQGHTTTLQAAGLTFPMQARLLPDLWAVTDYDVQMSDVQLPMDFTYDLWFTKAYRPTTFQKGDVELMIYLTHRNLTPAGKLYAARSFQTTVWLNGKRQTATFDVYMADPTLPNHTSELVSFVLRTTNTPGGAAGGLPAAYLGLDLKVMAAQMMSSLHGEFGWSTTTLGDEYLNGVELGSEFARHGAEAQLQWTLAHDCLVVPKSTTTAAYTSWSTFVCP